LLQLQTSHHAAADKLVERMWAIPSQTSEGKRAKVIVLLGYIMTADWREVWEEADYGIRETRDLLIEFVGGEPGQQLRDQFS